MPLKGWLFEPHSENWRNANSFLVSGCWVLCCLRLDVWGSFSTISTNRYAEYSRRFKTDASLIRSSWTANWLSVKHKLPPQQKNLDLLTSSNLQAVRWRKKKSPQSNKVRICGLSAFKQSYTLVVMVNVHKKMNGKAVMGWIAKLVPAASATPSLFRSHRRRVGYVMGKKHTTCQRISHVSSKETDLLKCIFWTGKKGG